MSRRAQFESIRSEGALLPVDLLQRVAERDKDLGGLRGEDYGLPPNEPLNEAIVRSWNRLVGAWGSFQEARERLPEDDPGTSATRDRWLLVLLQELGYGRVQTTTAIEIDGKSYAVSHEWGSVPLHLVGCGVPLDRRSRGVAGAATQSPHGTLQELLNRSEGRLWGLVSNGLLLRLLRDNSSLTRQAYLEFDLEQMLEGEVYADFVLLWLTCHASRVEGERPQACWLERWSQEAVKQGTRALDGLRKGVEDAIAALGSGFLQPGRNAELKAALRSGDAPAQEYYRELLRLIYRLLFLFVAEDRGLLHDPHASDEARARYTEWYSTRRLRTLAGRRRGTKHADLYEQLKLVMRGLGADDGCPPLGLPPLGSFLWSAAALSRLETASLPNSALLDAIRALATVHDGKVLRSVDYKNLGAEELGSVYESLLELHPELDADAGRFELKVAAGNERKTTGSYYTPTSLISVLLDSALDPVLEEAAAKGEEAILDLKVVDPACGSGHFLVAAAHRIAKRLASVRTGDEEPSPEATRAALRDVVSRCLYGVDVNPMAVELCKVSLWMEALDPGRPLSFLDAHVKCGNSLLGTTADLIAQGIPNEAFKAREGDDKEVVKALRKQNKLEREGQLSLEDEALNLVPGLEERMATLEAASDATPRELHAKERLFAELIRSDAYERAQLAANAWCAAFMQRKVKDVPRITTGVVRRIASGDSGAVPLGVVEEVRRLASEHAFFHWEIENPAVFGRQERGFDVVLGNPPWERVKLQAREFFAGHPMVAAAKTAAAMKRVITALEEEDPPLYESWNAALRRSEGESHFLRSSGVYPLCGRGDVNTYAVFAELMRSVLGGRGRGGCVVPTGIATDETTRAFFHDVVAAGNLVSLYDFENKYGIFPAVAPVVKFCLLTLRGVSQPDASGDFCFFLLETPDLLDDERHVGLAPPDFELLNPNSRTCPIFRSRRDAELTKAIYRRLPVLVRDGESDGNPWGVSFMRMFDMANASHLFHPREELEAAGFDLQTNIFEKNDRRLLPLYEPKLFHQFNHRFNTFDGVAAKDRFKVKAPTRAHSIEELSSRETVTIPRYWVEEREVRERVHPARSWHLAFRDMTNVMTNRRNAVFSILPDCAIGHSAPTVIVDSAKLAALLLASANSFVFDYLIRQKLAGGHLTYSVLKQIACPIPERLRQRAPFLASDSWEDWIVPRVLELSLTAVDVKPFAGDLGYHGEPFGWDVERREQISCELDGAFFHLYELERTDADYVMDTFPIVRRRDEQAHGEYRTKRLILEIYDELAEAIASGRPYQTRLKPSPADPRVAHPPRVDAPGAQPRSAREV